MERQESKLREEVVKIKGMKCNSCVERIEAKVGSLEGVEEIKVNLAEDKAIVKFDERKIDLEKIKSEINALGYCTCNKIPCICKAKENKKKTILQGIAYGIIPHIGCIAFIIGSVLGVTVLMQFFKPLLLNRYFFHILILISLFFATLSSVLYLRKNGLLSWEGAKKKWKYLAIMYGSTVGINLLLFFVIFPLFANVSAQPTGVTGAAIGIGSSNLSSLKLKVDIPCPGHAPLISSELKAIDGVIDVKFDFPNNFVVRYDPAKTSKQEILALEVFKTYKATVLEESSQNNQNNQQTSQQPSTPSCCGGSCGGSGGCGCGYR
jgi:copper ion binding protein